MIERAGAGLPPTAYRAEDGRIYRDIRRFVGYEDDPETGEPREVHELTPAEVYVSSATDPAGVFAAQRIARSRALDFYHPQYGWLRRGVKREAEWPENEGEAAQPKRRVSSPVAAVAAPAVERAAPVSRKKEQ